MTQPIMVVLSQMHFPFTRVACALLIAGFIWVLGADLLKKGYELFYPKRYRKWAASVIHFGGGIILMLIALKVIEIFVF